MADTTKNMEQISHLEEGIHPTQALPAFVKVDGGLLLDAGIKNEHHLKLAKDGRVSSKTHQSPWAEHRLT
jgi:hypothetical protein